MSIGFTQIVDQRLSLAAELVKGDSGSDSTANLAARCGVLGLLVSALVGFVNEVNQANPMTTYAPAGKFFTSIEGLSELTQSEVEVSALIELQNLMQNPASWLVRLMDVSQRIILSPLYAAAPTSNQPSLIAVDSSQDITTAVPLVLDKQLCLDFLNECQSLINRQREAQQEY